MLSTPVNKQIAYLPARPGVYLYKDDRGKIIYVGKAGNLRKRVKQYFTSPGRLPAKVQQLVASIRDLDFIVTDSEQEALILENNLIKKYKPLFNVSLKDDKSFPYLKIDINSPWPNICITRRYQNDGGKYFGPFASAGSIRQTFKLLKKIFPFRSCTKPLTGKPAKPCLNYHINRCLGPCTGNVSEKDYDSVIKQVILFLEGKQERILSDLRQKMQTASKNLDFERAALLRDQISAIESVIEAQKIAFTVRGEQDIIAIAQAIDFAYVVVFFIRNNKLVGRDNFILEGIRDESPAHIIGSFVKQYYTSSTYIPPLILLQYPLDEPDIITEWLRNRRGAGVSIHVPVKGVKKQLVAMAAENAQQGLKHYQIKKSTEVEHSIVLKELQERLKLPALPLRIECYDISNTRGNLAVGSMAVVEKGVLKPSAYRRFKIKTVSGIDDYSMIEEVLKRRFGHTSPEDEGWGLPDLVVIDGGKGHLNVAHKIMAKLDCEEIPIASLAKEEEEVFIPGQTKALDIPRSSAALHLLQRVRDEAHRFALTYHQKLRSKKSIASILDEVPGIGPKKKKTLLKQFGTLNGIREASIQELTMVKGISEQLAHTIKDHI